MSDTPAGPEGADLYDVVVSLGNSVDGLRADLAEEQKERAEAQVAIAAAERAIKVTEDEVKTGKRASRRSNLAIAAVAVLLLIQWRQATTRDHDRVHDAVVTCVNGNTSRAAIEARFQSFVAALLALQPPATTAEVAAARAAKVEEFRAAFAADPAAVALGPRDCSPKAVSSPTTITTATATTGP